MTQLNLVIAGICLVLLGVAIPTVWKFVTAEEPPPTR